MALNQVACSKSVDDQPSGLNVIVEPPLCLHLNEKLSRFGLFNSKAIAAGISAKIYLKRAHPPICIAKRCDIFYVWQKAKQKLIIKART